MGKSGNQWQLQGVESVQIDSCESYPEILSQLEQKYPESAACPDCDRLAKEVKPILEALEEKAPTEMDGDLAKKEEERGEGKKETVNSNNAIGTFSNPIGKGGSAHKPGLRGNAPIDPTAGGQSRGGVDPIMLAKAGSHGGQKSIFDGAAMGGMIGGVGGAVMGAAAGSKTNFNGRSGNKGLAGMTDMAEAVSQNKEKAAFDAGLIKSNPNLTGLHYCNGVTEGEMPTLNESGDQKESQAAGSVSLDTFGKVSEALLKCVSGLFDEAIGKVAGADNAIASFVAPDSETASAN